MKGDQIELYSRGYRFHSTWRPEKEREARECVARLIKYGERALLQTEGVNIKTADPKTNLALEWEREPGWSIWLEAR